jgi:hypothetical protein
VTYLRPRWGLRRNGTEEERGFAFHGPRPVAIDHRPFHGLKAWMDSGRGRGLWVKRWGALASLRAGLPVAPRSRLVVPAKGVGYFAAVDVDGAVQVKERRTRSSLIDATSMVTRGMGESGSPTSAVAASRLGRGGGVARCRYICRGLELA